MMTPDANLLTAILDGLIPANPDRAIPGAGELGIADFLLGKTEDAVLRDAIWALLSRAQMLADDVSPYVVRQLETECPEAFRVLLTETYKAYYSRPDMRAKMGVGDHPVHPDGYLVAPEPREMLAALVAPVRARGPRYRDPSSGGGSRDGE